jgi:structural maintenance of chromosomes protein 6
MRSYSDVFMDNVNRDVSMKMIVSIARDFSVLDRFLIRFDQIRAARRSVGRQFIFITPQSMSSVALDRDVKVIK